MNLSFELKKLTFLNRPSMDKAESLNQPIKRLNSLLKDLKLSRALKVLNNMIQNVKNH